MSSESFFFKGVFLTKFLAGELARARSEMEGMDDLGSEGACDVIYLKYSIEPLVLHEEQAEKNLTTGYRIVDPLFRSKHLPDVANTVKCRVIEHWIPFEGDERLFGFTTRPLPFYPFGRLEDGAFVISEKEDEDLYISNYQYNLILLRDCLKMSAETVRCYNSDLRTMIKEASFVFTHRYSR